MSYFKKSHSHKPKAGKGSYDRKNEMDEIEKELDLRDEEEAWREFEEMCPEYFEESFFEDY